MCMDLINLLWGGMCGLAGAFYFRNIPIGANYGSDGFCGQLCFFSGGVFENVGAFEV